MDIELAESVFRRWDQGLPVAEEVFYKAAAAFGLNPGDALLEARFYTCLDHDLKKLASGYVLDDVSTALYSAAAGFNPRELVKTASAYAIHPLELAFEKLAENNWVPNLGFLKLALMTAPVQADGAAGDQGASMIDPSVQGGDGPQAGQPESSQAVNPQQGAMVQQDPSQRFKPSPMAPVQMPPSQDGNLMDLSTAARHPEAGQQAGAGMGADPSGGSMMSDAGPQDPAPQMAADQKLLAVQQNIPPETLNRWAGKFQELEQQVGMSIDDPQQIAKFIAQMQKDDAKMVDQAIKNLSVQTAPVRPTIQQQAMQKQQTPDGSAGGADGGAADASGGPPPADGSPPAHHQHKPPHQPPHQSSHQPPHQSSQGQAPAAPGGKPPAHHAPPPKRAVLP